MSLLHLKPFLDWLLISLSQLGWVITALQTSGWTSLSSTVVTEVCEWKLFSWCAGDAWCCFLLSYNSQQVPIPCPPPNKSCSLCSFCAFFLQFPPKHTRKKKRHRTPPTDKTSAAVFRSCWGNPVFTESTNVSVPSCTLHSVLHQKSAVVGLSHKILHWASVWGLLFMSHTVLHICISKIFAIFLFVTALLEWL